MFGGSGPHGFDGAGGVVEAVERLAVPVVCDDLATLLRSRDRFEAKLSAGIGEVDAAELWDAEDATSMAAWLRTVLRATHGQAQRFVARARKLRPLPQTRAAWEAGRLSTAQVDAILARVSPKRLPAYVDCEADLVTQLSRLDGQDTVDVMAAWANLIDDLLGDDPADLDGGSDAASELFASRTLEGRTEVAGSLDADLGMIVRAALRAASTTDGPEDPVRSPAQKRADALADICKFFLDCCASRGSAPSHNPGPAPCPDQAGGSCPDPWP
jgi:hypothetical protein